MSIPTTEAPAGGDVQHARATTNVGRVEQRLHEPRGDPAEEVVVAGRLLLPARRLESVEGVGVHCLLGHREPSSQSS
jgi:hypothetical protein